MSTVVALLYDFDKTLGTTDMMDYEFIPCLGFTPNEFWKEANGLAVTKGMDGVLAYMYYMKDVSEKINKRFTREELVNLGKGIEFFKGVRRWFKRINKYGESLGLTVEHYVISSGLKEIIEGTAIAKEFKGIFASEFMYDDNGYPIWPKLSVNYTNKTQFVYRINKGVLDISNDSDLNASTPEDQRRVKFTNMIYIGDGLTDVPCMKLVKSSGGTSIALYNRHKTEVAKDMLEHERVDFAFDADYSEGSDLDIIMHRLLDKLAADNALNEERAKHRICL